jgi:hypothetical protein
LRRRPRRSPQNKTPSVRAIFRSIRPRPRGTFLRNKPPESTASRDPNLLEPRPIYPNANNWLVGGSLVLRNQSGNGITHGTYISSGRFTADYIRASVIDGDERGGARIQFVAETDGPTATRFNKLRASELYGFYKFLFPGVSATVRAGQFVIPFGLMASYDTSLQPIQPLYEKSLGLRVDTGVMLEGTYGPYRYAAAVTTGSGPNRADVDRNKVTTFRLERHFQTQAESGRLQVGGSILSGRGPVTDFATTLAPSGVSTAREFIDKTRFAADGNYKLAKLSARGELIFGADDQDPVWGYFGESSYPVIRRITATAMLKHWTFGQKPQAFTVIGVGLNIKLGSELILRTLYEYERDVRSRGGAAPSIDQRLSLQTRFDF